MRVAFREVDGRDAPVLAGLIDGYMRETFDVGFVAPTQRLADGLVAGWVRALLAERGSEPVGFVAWTWAWDLHHCVRGAEVVDLWVDRAHRGHGLAPRLVATVARVCRDEGGVFVKGQAVTSGSGRGLYERIAMSFPGTDCIVGGRAFRVLAELADATPRAMLAGLPDRAWNHEP